jgi:hypothetical protein
MIQALLALLILSSPAQAARGFSCVMNDGEYDYRSTGRFLDWAKQHSSHKCQTMSPRPEACRSLGCRSAQVTNELAKRSDAQRAIWDREARDAARAAARAPRADPRGNGLPAGNATKTRSTARSTKSNGRTPCASKQTS